ENLVYKHLKNNGYTVYIGKLKNYEIDFVAQKNNITKYFQVAYLLPDENVIKREFGNLLKINDNYEKTVISADELIKGDFHGIKHVNIKDFLTNIS
ncbi:MAG: ATPase, partial [Bacteroidetes bacterium]